MFGVLTIYHKLNLTDEETVLQILENPLKMKPIKCKISRLLFASLFTGLVQWLHQNTGFKTHLPLLFAAWMTTLFLNNPIHAVENTDKGFVLTPAEQAWLDKHPVVKVAVDPDWAPVEYMNEKGVYQGISIDYLNHLEKSLGIRLEIVKKLSWAEAFREVKNKQIDIFASVSRTPEREKFIVFTDPYLTMPINIFTRDDVSYIGNLKALNGKKVAVVKNYAIHEWLINRHPEIDLVEVNNIPVGLKLVSSGQVDAFVGNVVTASYYIGKMQLHNIRVAGETPYVNQQCMAVRDDWPQLAKIIDKGLKSIPQHEHENIYNRWMSIEYKYRFDYSLLVKTTLTLIVLFVLTIAWNRRLGSEIKQRKHAEQDLKNAIKEIEKVNQELSFTQFAVDNAYDGINLLTLDESKILYTNQRSCALLGYDREELLTMRIFDIDPLHNPQAWPRHIKELRENISMTFETKWKSKDNNIFPVEISSHLFQFKNKEYVISFIRDIREQKKVLREIENARLAAEAASQAKDEFLANMSHEIRTPLNAILGFAEILRSKETEPKNKHYIDTIYSSGHALLNIINDVLDLSKIEAGKLELSYTEVSMRSLLEGMRIIFEQNIIDNELEFTIDINEGVPELLILDETRVRQALINLIGNAVKFTEHGMVKVTAKTEQAESTLKDHIDLTIEVSDTGIGIPPEKQESIFKAFEQVGTMRNQHSGTGLGLTITKKLATIMNGELSLQSELGKGSTFKIVYRDVELATRSLPIVTSGIDTRLIKFQRATILIADDLDFNSELLTTYLEEQDFKFIYAKNGRETIEQVKKHNPDIILLDMKMPEVDGYEASAILKSDEQSRNIPIIAITASALKQDQDKISKTCDSFLPKPIRRDSLIKELMLYLKTEGDTKLQ